MRGFVKDQRLGGVKILGDTVSHDAPAESYDTAVRIHDRKHDPVPELIMDLRLLDGHQP